MSSGVLTYPSLAPPTGLICMYFAYQLHRHLWVPSVGAIALILIYVEFA